VFGGVLLGPIIYLRLDLIPAVATIWAVERAASGRWGAAGGWLGFGALAKVYPGFLVFPAFEVATNFKRFLAGTAIVSGVILLPVIVTGNVPDLIHDVVSYHTGRGVQLESTWGSLLLVAHRFGYSAGRVFQFGSFDVDSSISPMLKSLGFVFSLAALGVGWRVVARSVPRGDAFRLAVGMSGSLALLLFFGTVYSPQFTVWLLALASAALCGRLEPRLRVPLVLVLLACLLTQLEFPYGNDEILGSLDPGNNGGLFAVLALTARNFLVGGIGVSLLVGLWKSRDASAGQLPQPEHTEGSGDRDGSEQKDESDQGVPAHGPRIEP
jgi:hypothetical protein